MPRDKQRIMLNPCYDPEKAHCPSDADIRRWRNGGRKEHEKQKKNIQSTKERFLRHDRNDFKF